MNKLTSFLRSVVVASALTAAFTSIACAAPKKDFKIAWSIYVGWMPWGYAADTGIVKKWADKYGITIEVKQFNDYVESINQYTAGAFDAVTITNMDALSIPAAGGVDTTAVIVGDFSNGNDARDPEGARPTRGHQGPEGQSRRVLGLALSAGARAREHRGSPRRTSRSSTPPTPTSSAAFKTPEVDRGGDMESASSRDPRRNGRERRCSIHRRFPARSWT